MQSILTQSASPLQKAIDIALGKALAKIPLKPIFNQWDPREVAEPLLIYLAWALNVDNWDSKMPVSQKRQLVESTVQQHFARGTPSGLRRYLAIFNITDYELIEGWQGDNVPPGIGLEINQPISNLTADLVFDQINRYLPGRSYVKALDFTGGVISYDGTIDYDAEFNYGAVSNG
jgi:phage tail P2-like protein